MCTDKFLVFFISVSLSLLAPAVFSVVSLVRPEKERKEEREGEMKRKEEEGGQERKKAGRRIAGGLSR